MKFIILGLLCDSLLASAFFKMAQPSLLAHFIF
nr:MAG TPA: hypothetical protein [Caudoviricetes sp.]